MDHYSVSSRTTLARDRAVIGWQIWTAVYVFALLSPIVLLAIAPSKGGDRLDLFALYAGYLGFTSYVLQLVLPGRLPYVTPTFGVPLLLRVHRVVGWMVLVFIALHVAVFAVRHDEYRGWLLWPFDDSSRAILGWIAVVSLLLLLVSTIWRRKLKIPFEAWRGLHVVLGLVGTSTAFAHVLVISWYSAYPPLRWLMIGIFVLGIVSVGYLRIVRPFSRLAAPYVVRAVVPERGGAVSLQLEAAGHHGVHFEPGQFAWIKVDGGAYSLTEHPFSFASSARQPQRPSFTIKGLGDFTREVGAIPVGSQVLLDGPHGAWAPPLPDAGYVLIVAGIGITPAMSIMRTAADMGDNRPIRLLYGARSWEDITFREEIDALGRRSDLSIEPWYVLEKPPEGWPGHSGRVDLKSLPKLLPPDAGARNYFICGPPMMIDSVLAALNTIGVPDDLVYADRF